MTTEKPGRPSADTGKQAALPERPPRPQGEAEERTEADVRRARLDRKRERIRAEIERNRAGNHKVPTWVLAALLGLVVLAWVILVIAS